MIALLGKRGANATNRTLRNSVEKRQNRRFGRIHFLLHVKLSVVVFDYGNNIKH
jgi:hypothetical protein